MPCDNEHNEERQRRDILFLHEFSEFSCKTSLSVGKSFYSTLKKAYDGKEFDIVAHMVVRIHAEMLLNCETFGALLFAFARWISVDGILGTMLKYKLGSVPKFVERLMATRNPLDVLGFPTKEDVMSHFSMAENEVQSYSHEEATKIVTDFGRLYLDKLFRGIHNKSKHGSLILRDPRVIDLKEDTFGSEVYVPLNRNDGSGVDRVCFEVVRPSCVVEAEKALKTIETVTQFSKAFAGFYARCLELNILQIPTNLDSNN